MLTFDFYYLLLKMGLMYPYLGRVGPFLIYSYTTLLAAGVLASWALLLWQARQTNPTITAGEVGNGVLAALAGALLGGRMGFVLLAGDYFAGQRVTAVLQVWQGGLNYHGALLGGLLVGMVWLLVGQRPLSPWLGRIALAMPVLTIFGWAACLLEGCAYGQEAVYYGQFWRDWLVADLPDTYGLPAVRVQTQLLGMLGALVTLGIIGRLRATWKPLPLFYLSLGLLNLLRLPVSLLRGDSAPLWWGVRGDFWLDGVGVMLCALLLLQYSYRWGVRGDQLHKIFTPPAKKVDTV